MSEKQQKAEGNERELTHIQPNFQEIRTASGGLLFELDYGRMVVRVKKNGVLEIVDLLSQLNQFKSV